MERSSKERTGDDGSTTWMRLRDAAERSGVEVSTIRRWVRAERIRSRLDAEDEGARQNMRRMVVLEDVLRQSELDDRDAGTDGEPADRAPEEPSAGAQGPTTIVVPLDRWADVTDRLAELERRVGELLEAVERADQTPEEEGLLRQALRELQRRVEVLEDQRIPGDLRRSSANAEQTPAGDDRVAGSDVTEVEVEWRTESEPPPRWTFLGRTTRER
jgi:hypothetical protein